ncbi:MAG TPA: hypothetical protein PLS46_02790 [Microthrixaceae bacterium]|nr:hypothetical protein [Microthrixaceae bacterium]
MADVDEVGWCSAPGRQPVLFHVTATGAPSWSVIDRDGIVRVRSSSLGVAMTAARRVLIEQGEVWMHASDDSCAHLDPARVASDTPSLPWIQTIAAHLGGTR